MTTGWTLRGAAAALAGCALFWTGMLAGAGRFARPKSVLHVVTVKWSAEASPEQREAAIAGVEKMAQEIPGVKNVWLRPLHLQPRDFAGGFAIEFESQAAAERFARHPAYEAWNKASLPLREETRVQQVTN